ncbi:MAG: hypothetical protein NTU44_01905 [Bacteroidetes bacterium]|nr:hypothetical protein [Bacteroidota bacterium]
MKENLNIGTLINGSDDPTNNSTIEKYCYDNDEYNCAVYGGLYQWDEMMQYSTVPGAQGICPGGYHIPTDSEWDVLSSFLGSDTIAGEKLKEAGFDHWSSPNNWATNESGFTALGAGFLWKYSSYSYGFVSLQGYTYFWSSSDNGTNFPGCRYLDNYATGFFYSNQNVKTFGQSVRCLMD